MDKRVLDSLWVVIEEFRENPYAFLYEEDIRATLFCEMRKRMPEMIKIKGNSAPEAEYQLREVYCEYGTKIDIACLDTEAEISRDKHKGYDTFIYGIPIKVGIELKYRKIGDSFSVQESVKDYEKLKEAGVAHCLALAFVQDENKLEDFLRPGTESKEMRRTWSDFCNNPEGVFVISKSKILQVSSGSVSF
ncbi:hypothetical protein B1757_10185 [Acidithiobacillus marinus]|uniref:Restriction endonuclease n=1 Tax=Acidithiobacillus marinus TaxID=187490 RepID=A0A2I1DKQ2_9PROT|nr:hypothetical protein [Acidithiobacillus marinus]PKY10453.1 hypothetical protein B1757_10185 [Acidithiobacillus marinus]